MFERIGRALFPRLYPVQREMLRRVAAQPKYCETEGCWNTPRQNTTPALCGPCQRGETAKMRKGLSGEIYGDSFDMVILDEVEVFEPKIKTRPADPRQAELYRHAYGLVDKQTGT